MRAVLSQPASAFSKLEGGGFRGSRGGRAFAAAVLGWFVFPLRRSDHAATAAAHIATNEPADIYDLWGIDLAADHDIGVACGPSQLLVVECSTRTGLDTFLSRHGLSPAVPTVVVRFGDSQHLYYSARDLTVELGTVGFDLGSGAAAECRADYVVGAGSWRDGFQYEYAPGFAPDETRIAALAPDWAKYLKRTSNRVVR